MPKSTSTATAGELLFEIGCEELPAGFIDPACAFLQTELPRVLGEARIAFDTKGLVVEGTPRRLVVMATGLAARQDDKEELVTGPLWSVAFDGAGNPTPAGEGFFKKLGLDPKDARPQEGKKGPVVAVTKRELGQPTAAVLPGLLAQLIPRIPFRKTMRWGDRHVTRGAVFGRPVQWLLALWQGAPLAIAFADVQSGNTTRGHRYHAPQPVVVTSIASYHAALAAGSVMLARAERKAHIATQAEALARLAGGRLRADDALLELVKNLVEKAWPLLGHFEPRFLGVPKELLISEMREHQKYFAVENDAGELLPCFVVVAGADAPDKAALAAGNARVLRARFEDGAFYHGTDLARTLHGRVADLERLIFHKQLGHLGHKTHRIQTIALWLVDALVEDLRGRGVAVARFGEDVSRAAHLCKADLTTGVVGEFPELQGVMGRYCALHDGEHADVAWAVEDHHAPRHAGAPLPRNDVAAVVGLADRLDTLAAILAIGKGPTGSADPFALRRAAIAVLTIALERRYAFSLEAACQAAGAAVVAQGFVPGQSGQSLGAKVVEFVRGRLRGVLVERLAAQGHTGCDDIVDAALAAGSDDLPDLWDRVTALVALRGQDAAAFAALAATFKRVGNIIKKAREDGLDIPLAPPALEDLEAQAERELRDAVAGLGLGGSHEQTLGRVAALKPAVDRFFDDVMVLVDDARLRAARLGLLGAIERELSAVADFTRLQAQATGA